MASSKNISHTLFLNMTIVTATATIVLGSFWSAQEYARFREEAERIRSEGLDAKKNILKGEVDDAVEYIQFERSRMQARIEQQLQERVTEAISLAQHICKQHGKENDYQEAKELLREILRLIRFDEGRGHYFALTLAGEAQLLPETPALKEQSLLPTQDGTISALRGMLGPAKANGKAFYTWTGASADPSSSGDRRAALVQYFAPFDWVIGACIHVSDKEQDLQEEVLQWINQVRFEGDNYIFVDTWDGLALAGPAIGQNMYNVEDPNGIKIVQELITLAKRGGGFVEYVMPKLEGKRPDPKLSFARGVPEWKWCVGAGMYIDSIEREIAYAGQGVKKRVYKSMLEIALLSSGLLGLAWLASRRVARQTNHTVNAFVGFFRKATREYAEMPTAGLGFSEFEQVAASANNMIAKSMRTRKALEESEATVRSVFRAAPVGICIMKDRVYQSANEYWCQHFGYPEETILGKTTRFLYESNEEYNRVGEALYAQLRTGGIGTAETRLRRADGVYRDVVLTAASISSHDPFSNVVVIIHDITERKLALEARFETLARFSGFAEASQYGMGMAELDGHIVYVNSTLAKMLGEKSPQDCLGKYFPTSYYSESMARKLQDEVMPALMKDKHWHGELELLTPDGRSMPTDENFFVIHDEQGQPRYIADILTDITERKRAEIALRENEARLRNLSDNLPGGMAYQVDVGTDGQQRQFTYLSAGVEKLHELTAEAALRDAKLIYGQILEADRAFVAEREARAIASWTPFVAEVRVQLPSGAIRWSLFTSAPRRAPDGHLLWDGIEVDITERKRAEEEKAQLEGQLQQAQRLESVGRLAGGIAHDFNNMLGVIIGHAELAIEKLPSDDPLRAELEEIHKAAERSANLTNQLLAFARLQTVAPKVLNLNETIESMLRMLGRLIGEDIELRWKPCQKLDLLRIDPAQVDQLLANLVVNARDAIDGVGKITIETGMSDFDAEYCATQPGSAPGRYVMLAITDDGCGMDEQTKARIFEPFFTTKQSGKGTGLGLATVYGIVKQNRGVINVYSEPGHGTTFRIYLPAHAEVEARKDERGTEAPAKIRGHETILLVEDEPTLLAMTTKMLETLGYQVRGASTPGEAIRLVEERACQINLLITDVVMPEMNGRALADRLLALCPQIKCLFMSGYTAEVIANRGVLEEGLNFVQKPFSRQGLAESVRKALDQAQRLLSSSLFSGNKHLRVSGKGRNMAVASNTPHFPCPVNVVVFRGTPAGLNEQIPLPIDQVEGRGGSMEHRAIVIQPLPLGLQHRVDIELLPYLRGFLTDRQHRPPSDATIDADLDAENVRVVNLEYLVPLVVGVRRRSEDWDETSVIAILRRLWKRHQTQATGQPG